MPDLIFDDLALRALSFALDGLSLRQRVTANNIANVDTPGYKAQQVSFEAQLQHALAGDTAAELPLQTTDPGHLGGSDLSSSPLVAVERRNSDLRNDGNNVDIDLETTTLAETALRYQALTQLAWQKLSLLKSIVRDVH
jgi:flagellar basal-body rod protein FlgB